MLEIGICVVFGSSHVKGSWQKELDVILTLVQRSSTSWIEYDLTFWRYFIHPRVSVNIIDDCWLVEKAVSSCISQTHTVYRLFEPHFSAAIANINWFCWNTIRQSKPPQTDHAAADHARDVLRHGFVSSLKVLVILLRVPFSLAKMQYSRQSVRV